MAPLSTSLVPPTEVRRASWERLSSQYSPGSDPSASSGPEISLEAVAPWLTMEDLGEDVVGIIQIAPDCKPRMIKWFNNAYVVASRLHNNLIEGIFGLTTS